MRYTEKVLHVLLAIRDRPLHGYAIRKTVLQLSDGTVDLEPGGLYRLISKLESDGLLEPTPPPSDAESSDPRRRYYALTETGRRILRAEAARLAKLVDRPEFKAVLHRG